MTKFIKLSKYPVTIFSLIFFLLLAISTSVTAQNVEEGEKLYKANCTACHQIDSKLIGPSLRGVSDKYSEEWLIKWIKNSAELIASGDADAIAIFEEYGKVAMTDFYFEDADMEALLAYLENPPVEEVKVATTGKGVATDKGMKGSTKMMLVALILLILVFVLTSAKNSLKESLGQETETIPETLISQTNLFLANNINKLFVGLFVMIVVLKFVFDSLMGVGVTTNYQPEQPIAFSHKIHAGDNSIDCNYCHSSARSSKTAGIPSANVCMNCHANITSGTTTGTTEIQKIYDAIGYDPDTRTYIEGYDQKPIEWVRIHNLADFAYYNHAQHVTVAGLDCQKCHGPVEEMHEMYQYSPLTMGWCIDCHRETEVDLNGTEYYKNIHDQLANKYGVENVTAAEMGGLECGKCHY